VQSEQHNDEQEARAVDDDQGEQEQDSQTRDQPEEQQDEGQSPVVQNEGEGDNQEQVEENNDVQLQGEAISPTKTNAEQHHEERDPKLYVDVNVANYGLQRIIVYEGDTVDSLVTDFTKRCPIDEFMIEKLKLLLQQQIDGVLERIDEDQEAADEDEEDNENNNNNVK